VNDQTDDYKTCYAKPNMDVVVENSIISDIFSSTYHYNLKTTVIKLEIYNCVMHFLPHNFDKYLKKITDLVVYYTGLKSITKHDLKQFQLLEYLLITNNDLTFIDGDLLEYSPNVKYIDLRNNKIFYISEKLPRPQGFLTDGNYIKAQEYYEKIVTHFDGEIKRSFTLIEKLEKSDNFQSTNISDLRFRMKDVEISIKDIVKVSDYDSKIYEIKESQEKLNNRLISVEGENQKQKQKIESFGTEIKKIYTVNEINSKNDDQDKRIESNSNNTKSLRNALKYTNGNMTETIKTIKDEIMIKINEIMTQNEVHSLKGEINELTMALKNTENSQSSPNKSNVLIFILITFNVILITIVIILICKINSNVNQNARELQVQTPVMPNELIYSDPNYDELPSLSNNRNNRRTQRDANYGEIWCGSEEKRRVLGDGIENEQVPGKYLRINQKILIIFFNIFQFSVYAIVDKSKKMRR
jgi:hypothetical protein